MDGSPNRRGRRPTETLTQTQARVLREVRDFIAHRGLPPTAKELGDSLGVTPATAHEQVGHLVRKGYLRREPRKARGLFLLREPDQEPADLVSVPLRGIVPAGVPLLAEDNTLGEVMVERKLVASGRCFALRVTGDSMQGASIRDGDVVIVRQQPVAENGDIVVAQIKDDEATVKRLSIREHEIELRPENPAFQPIRIGPDHDLRIIGKVVGVRRACGPPSPFLAQDYPGEQRKLLILDDAGQIESQDHGSWQVISTPERFPSLPGKYNAMLTAEGIIGMAQRDRWNAVAVWDDDDIYLPWHLSAAAEALVSGAPSAKPSQVWSLYNSEVPFLEDATGRFHGSLVVSVERLRQIGGWIQTRRADFDQQQIAACGSARDTLPPSPGNAPSYVFRWQSTEANHCQGLMSSPGNEDWYDRYLQTDRTPVGEVVPRFDAETATLISKASAGSLGKG